MRGRDRLVPVAGRKGLRPSRDVNMNNLPQRKHPVHPPPVERMHQPTVLHVTVCLNDDHLRLDNPTTHNALRKVWSEATAWRVGHYTVMPDHVHLFCAPAVFPPTSVKLWAKYWKGQFRRLLNLDRSVWQRDVWDTQMRNFAHYVEKHAYVEQNPVRRGLVERPEDWPYRGEMHVIRW